MLFQAFSLQEYCNFELLNGLIFGIVISLKQMSLTFYLTFNLLHPNFFSTQILKLLFQNLAYKVTFAFQARLFCRFINNTSSGTFKESIINLILERMLPLLEITV